MITPEYCCVMSRYNRWMNQRLYEICAQLPDAERCADRGAFFKSVFGTLNHIFDADTVWLRRFRKQSLEGFRFGVEFPGGFDALRVARAGMDAEIERWSAQVDAAWLARDFTATSIASGNSYTRPTWQLVAHLFNHQTHHRGQLTTLLSQQGIDPGVTDLAALPLELA